MPVNKLFTKAIRLLRTGRITYLEGGLYDVVGDHGSYRVKVLSDNRLVCTCEGFQRRKVCSHIIAVMMRRIEKGLA